jgi:hypothetical protein
MPSSQSKKYVIAFLKANCKIDELIMDLNNGRAMGRTHRPFMRLKIAKFLSG